MMDEEGQEIDSWRLGRAAKRAARDKNMSEVRS